MCVVTHNNYGGRMNIQDKVNDLNQHILSGNALEAFEKYYHEDIAMQENNEKPTKGKEANRKREQEFFGAITEFHGAEVKNIAIGSDVSMVEWFMDFTHKDWGRVAKTQVSVQKWKDGKIINEKFYY